MNIMQDINFVTVNKLSAELKQQLSRLYNKMITSVVTPKY